VSAIWGPGDSLEVNSGSDTGCPQRICEESLDNSELRNNGCITAHKSKGKVKLLKRLGLYLRTARYYRATQIAARLRLTAKARLSAGIPGIANRRYKNLAGFAINPQFRCFERATGSELLVTEAISTRTSQMKRGRFNFLNLEKDLGAPIDWDPADTTRLWRYNLHYFDYAIDLALQARWQKDQTAAGVLGRLFVEWIDGNPFGEGVGWHSYPISRRIVNWIQAVSLASPEAVFKNQGSESRWLASLYAQARYLEDHLEFDCMGNHLLANGNALVFAGLFFAGKEADRWFRRGEDILWRGLEEQIHADGGHEERSPMYQTIVLQDYLEVIAALRLNGKAIPDRVTRVLIGMADFVDGLRHPDGGIALFADSAFSIAQDPEDVLAAASRLLTTCGRWSSAQAGPYSAMIAPRVVSAEKSQANFPGRSASSWPDTGYFKLTGAKEEDKLIVDARPMGPKHLPAHGHCSLFSYELSLDGKRFIVDSGVEEYEGGPWRDFWRSTRAHNTLTVDGEEQTEIWASFRAARRTQLQECSFTENEFGSMFVGCHGGFAAQKRRTPHRRIIAGLREGIWLVFDQILGSGEHLLDSYVHLHPKAWCEVAGQAVELGRDATRVRLYPLAGALAVPTTISSVRGAIDPIQGWYAPEFGKREPNSVLRLSSNAKLPGQMGYLIAPHEYKVQSWKVDVKEARMRVVEANILIDLGTRKIERQFRVPAG
jgi:uncharacterized heparinase superfamily protein